MAELLIRGVSFDPEGGCAIEYCSSVSDVTSAGVVVNHTVFIPEGPEYDNELTQVRESVQTLLADVLEDVNSYREARELRYGKEGSP